MVLWKRREVDARCSGEETMARSRLRIDNGGKLRGGVRARILARGRRITAGVALASVLGLVIALTPALPAAAAGQPDVLVSVTDASGTPITSVVPTLYGGEYQVRVSYTCTGDADCTNMKVSIAAPPLDPYFGTQRKEASSTWIPPFSPAPPITGTLETGYTVDLGTRPAGDTGVITFRYMLKARAIAGCCGGNAIGWGNYFPPGYAIAPQVTVTADNAATVTKSDKLATYDSVIPEPTVTAGIQPAVKTGVEMPVAVEAHSQCWNYSSSYGNVQAQYHELCGDSGTVTVKLPARAVWVSGSGGTYDSSTHAVTLTAGPKATRGLLGGTFKVTFPSANYPTTGAGCYVDETFEVSGSVTYLNGVTKSPPTSTKVTTVDNCAPFMKGSLTKLGSGTSYKIPTSAPTTGLYWYVDTFHQGNKPGVVTVTDDVLDQPGMPVYQINTESAATINYTLDNGVTGSAAATTSYVAPAGRHIVKATVVSAPLTGPNLDPDGTASTRFRVAYYYSVLPGATPGDRTNTASATITYPDYPAVPPFTPTGSPDSHTVNLYEVTPFAKANMAKYANAASYDIRAATYTGNYWYVDTCNGANVQGVATVTDDALDQPGMPVYNITVNLAGTINYTLNDGTTGSTNALSYTAPAGKWIVKATVESPALAGPNTVPTGAGCTLFRVVYYFSVLSTAQAGDRTNTASVTMTYPNTNLGTITPTGSPATRTVNLYNAPYTITANTVSNSNTTNPDFAPRAGDEVLWKASGQFCALPTDKTMTPQYVFLAPKGWTVLPGGSSLAGNPDATFVNKTVTYKGVTYSAVVVQLTTPVAGRGATASDCYTMPELSVKTTPTLDAVVGTQTANFFVGDAAGIQAAAYAPVKETETTSGSDIDADGNTTDAFALRTGTSTLQGVPRLLPVKEICQPDPTQADGCKWIADPAVTVGVPPTASSIKYRVTIKNTGQTNLSNVTIYDVLPYPGDTGTSDTSAGTPRGSTVKEQLSSLTVDSPSGMTLQYSTSTNPPRPEVYSGATTGTWGAPMAGASAIKATIPILNAGSTRTFTYEAALVGGVADQTACNSLAVSASTMVASEPPRVCASTQEADLEIETANRLPLQAERVGVVPFAVTNKGGSALASGVVTLKVPAGLAVESLTIPLWSCTAPSTEGPVDVTCKPVQSDGVTTRELAKDVTETLPLQVRPTSTASDELCVDAEIQSVKYDPTDDNNTASSCAAVVETGPELSVTKDDGKSTVAPTEEYTYTITVANRLVAEAVPGATLTDTLPSNVQLVSSSPAATVDGQTLTWNLGALSQAGVPSADGGAADGGAGSTTTVSVTVKVPASATGTIVNTARLSAPDPADSSKTLSAQATDTDELRRVSIAKSSNAAAAGVRPGDVVTYTVTLTNDGTVDYTAGDPARLVDDLSGVLDDAAFVSGSAKARVDGDGPANVADPVDGRLTWSGALDAGSALVLTYQVTVGAGQPGDVLTNTAYAAGEPSSCTDGFTPAGQTCASVTTQFAPTLAKVVTSSVQNDDGTWTIVYSVVVTNDSPTTAATYTLSDALAFGSGISVASAAVSEAPDGVTTAAWTGSGTIVAGVSIPANSQHAYEITVVADAGATGGTPAGRCATGVAGGFANRATLTTTDGRTAAAEACAAPVEPTVEKTVAPAAQRPDGRWDVVYTVTVTNTNATALPYTLDDVLGIPSGITVDEVTVSGPAGAPVNPAFDGVDDTALLTGGDRIPAGSAVVPATRVFTVALVVDAAQAGSAGISALTCAPAGTGGYQNTVTLLSGTSSTELDSADACTNALPLPTPEISKRVVSTAVDIDGIWSIEYEIAVENPDSQYSTRYSLEDDLQFAAGVTILGAQITSSDATVSGTWDGQTDTVVNTGQALPAATTHTYTVVVNADPGEFDAESAAADCRLDANETASGYSNVATVTAGVRSVFASACEPINDPSAVKTTVGQPTQDPDTGIWTVQYEITVKNRSATTVGEIPYTLTDELGFPAEVDVVDVDVEAPAGVTVNPDFDGVDDTEIADAGIGAAANDTDPATQVYAVRVQFTVPGGITAGTYCDPAQGAGGLRNEVELAVGARISGAVACADVPEVPLAGVAKSVASQEQLPDGTWEVLYRVTVANPSGTAASEYSLEDAFGFGEGIELAEPASVVASPDGVTVEPGWDGVDAVTIAEDILLPAAGSHTYTVRAVIDSGTVTGDDPAGDCVWEPGESGTGFGNTATVGSDVASAGAEVCARAWDPGVTKELNGVPVQQPDGSWLLSYTMTVSNPSPVGLSYGLVDELDFPADTEISIVSAAGRAGAPAVNPDWDGQSDLQLVADGAALPANAVHVFDVTVRALLPEDQDSQTGGWVNTATVVSGVDGVIESAAVAEADILVPELTVAKVATPSAGLLRIGDTVEYEVTMENVGEGAFTGLYPAVVWDDLADVLDDADLVGEPVADPAVGGFTFTGDAYRFAAPLMAGGTVTFSYSVAVADHDGDADLVNVAYVSDPTGDGANPPTTDECAAETCAFTDTPLAALEVVKTVSTAVASPGDRVSYTVSVSNTGQADIPAEDPAVITDTLADVLDDAGYNGDATADTGTVSVAGTTLTWTGGLGAGDTVTITYSVTVNASAADGAELVNTAITDATLLSLAPGGGATADQVSTSTRVHRLAVTGADGWIAGLGIALTLLVGGGIILLLRRRRRTTPQG
jgi:uncharacterized repeat protein (TIGR01451 family)/fimbrial isopeptide formation D2 family protein